MRTIKILTAIAAALALMIVPAAAQARGHHGARAHGKTAKKLGVVRSFRHGLLTIRLASGGSRSAEVTDNTALSCKPGRKASRKRDKASRKGRRPVPRPKRRRGRGRLATASTNLGWDVYRPAADEDPVGDIDEGDDEDLPDSDMEPAEPGDDAGESGTDVEEDDDAGEDVAKPRRAKRRGCSTASLRRGMRVKTAKRASGPDGPVWTKLVLQRRR